MALEGDALRTWLYGRVDETIDRMKAEGKDDDLTRRVLNGMLDAYVRTLEEACDVDRTALGNYVQVTLHGSSSS
jgi:hypothetical protein